jgi:hypothetical protein
LEAPSVREREYRSGGHRRLIALVNRYARCLRRHWHSLVPVLTQSACGFHSTMLAAPPGTSRQRRSRQGSPSIALTRVPFDLPPHRLLVSRAIAIARKPTPIPIRRPCARYPSAQPIPIPMNIPAGINSPLIAHCPLDSSVSLLNSLTPFYLYRERFVSQGTCCTTLSSDRGRGIPSTRSEVLAGVPYPPIVSPDPVDHLCPARESVGVVSERWHQRRGAPLSRTFEVPTELPQVPRRQVYCHQQVHWPPSLRSGPQQQAVDRTAHPEPTCLASKRVEAA